MQEKIVLIGAGSAMFTRGLVTDLIRRGEALELGLVDIDPEALTVAEGLTRKMIAAGKAPIRLAASTDRRDILPGATVVICTVGVGGRRAWEQDVFIPRKYGIFQPVGDSVMPGGTSRALRMIPAMVAIAEDVLELCPQALFFNYGNPMAPVCRAIRKATGAPVVGLCHGVFGVAGYLAGALGVDLATLRYTAVGMNHMTWFTEVRVNGQDAMPRLHDVAKHKIAEAAEGKVDNPFSWQMLQLFGAFPAVLDRHVTEFFPQLFATGEYGIGAAERKTLGVDVFSLEETIAYGDRIYAQMKEDALSQEPLPADYFERVGGEHEQVVEIIDSIRRDTGRIYSVNLPNTGQVPNLPMDAIIEAPAVAEANGLRAITQPELPVGIVGTLATRLAWVETVVEAALEGSRDTFVQALILDGAVRSVQMAEELADELLAAHAAYLPQFA
jgi:alpha-galactosidase